MHFENFIGIDISKLTLDICLITSQGELLFAKIENDRLSIKKYLKTLFRQQTILPQDTLICAEHTGHFGNKLIDACVTSGLSLWVESAYNIIHSQGMTRGKDDKTDAQRIAIYAKRFSDSAKLYRPKNSNIKLLERLFSERELVVKDIAKYKSQLKQEEGFFDARYFKEKQKRIQRLMKCNQNALNEIQEKIDEIISNDIELANTIENITSIPGVGLQTALATIIATDNFNRFNNARKFCCHAGCAPFRYQSGSSIKSKHRVSQRANKNLKKIFHMAALSTLRTSGEFREYFDRKVAEGKNKMTVINALRAKLIHRIFALAKQNRKYEYSYLNSLV